jgi:hypothetical protein
MFKSIDSQSGEEIIILDRYWNRNTVEILRSKSRENTLRCPECQQPVVVKAGHIKRWHFAHQDLGNCPLRNESGNILQARSLLYAWLHTKYPNKVTVEKGFPGTALPRPVDCYVEPGHGKKFAYWILESGLRSRDELQLTFHRLHVMIHWVFLSNMLRYDDNPNYPSVLLTPTERAFAYESEYNTLYTHDNDPGVPMISTPFTNSALNYLNAEEQRLMTFRGLFCIHSPHQYAFKKMLVEQLEKMLISPKTGEFIYPGEYEHLQAYREAQQKAQEEMEQRRAREEHERQQLFTDAKQALKQSGGQSSNQSSFDYLSKVYACRVCGEETQEWVELDLSTNTCICRQCSSGLT